jgi:hypothetical protein
MSFMFFPDDAVLEAGYSMLGFNGSEYRFR